MGASWKRFNHGDCPVCNGARKDCRQNTQTNLIHCRNTEANPTDYLFQGQDSIGFGLWADKLDAEDWKGDKREEYRLERERQKEAERERFKRSLSPVERDQEIRKILNQLTLSNFHREQLLKRGFTDEQINAANYRSVTQWQKLDFPVSNRLAGTNPEGTGLLNFDGGILIPIPNVDGLYTACQIRLDNPKKNDKYPWLSSSKRRVQPNLQNGELPLAIYKSSQESDDGVVGLTEGTGFKPFLASLRLGIPVIGASGGNFSLLTLKESLEKLKAKQVILFPDAGSIQNPNVLAQYRKLFDLLNSWKYPFSAAWWEQLEKSDGDIDEISDEKLQAIVHLSVNEFLAKAPEKEKRVDMNEEKKPKSKPKTERLIELGLEIGKYFKGTDGESYCSIGTETFKVASNTFKTILYKAFYDRYQEGLTSEAWSNGRIVLKANCDSNEVIPVYLRTAYKDGFVTIDLGKQYIHIDKDEWRTEETTSLKFIRTASSQALPVPTRKIKDLPAALDRLGKLVNLLPDSLRLLLAWMTFTFLEGLPKPLLCFTGTHGSGKSTVSRLVKDLLDPDSLGLGTTPNDSRNLAIACQKRWLLAFDNSSGFNGEVSDALCRVVTGAGFSARTLYSDGEETIFSFKRPVLLNGIGDFINRPDLLDRSMILELDPLEERLSERQLQDAIAQIKPGLLGFLFTSISKALPIFETLDDYQYDLPRMADFGLWLVALEKAWGLADGLLLNAFNGNQSRSSEIALETSPVALAIFKLFEGGRIYWDGTTQELLDDFLKSDIFATLVKAKDFPKTVQGLRTSLARLTPDLAKQGFEIEKTRSKISRKVIIRKLNKIESLGLASSPSSPTESQPLEPSHRGNFKDDDTGDDTGDDRVTIPEFEKEPSANIDKKGDDTLLGDDRVTIPKNTIVIDTNQSVQGLQKTGDDGDDTQAKLSMSVKIKDGSFVSIGSKVKLPDHSVANVISIESEESIRLEGYSQSFSAYSLEAAA